MEFFPDTNLICLIFKVKINQIFMISIEISSMSKIAGCDIDA